MEVVEVVEVYPLEEEDLVAMRQKIMLQEEEWEEQKEREDLIIALQNIDLGGNGGSGAPGNSGIFRVQLVTSLSTGTLRITVGSGGNGGLRGTGGGGGGNNPNGSSGSSGSHGAHGRVVVYPLI